MLLHHLFALSAGPLAVAAAVFDRPPLSYQPIPDNAYAPPKVAGQTTLLELVASRPELSTLNSMLQEVEGESSYTYTLRESSCQVLKMAMVGFTEAFDTPTSWSYTFLAPSNEAFNMTGQYFTTFAATPKGKWWLGNLIQHHYIPNSKLNSTVFNSTDVRFQTGSYLYVSGQTLSGQLMFNNVSAVVEADIPVTNVSVISPLQVTSLGGWPLTLI